MFYFFLYTLVSFWGLLYSLETITGDKYLPRMWWLWNSDEADALAPPIGQIGLFVLNYTTLHSVCRRP